MDGRLRFFAIAGAVLLVAAGWLRGAAQAGSAWIMAELEAMPKTEGAALIDHVRPDNEGRLVLARGMPTLVASARDSEGRVVTANSLLLRTTVERYEEKVSKNGGDKTVTRSWTGTNGGERFPAQATLGAFELAPELLNDLDALVAYPLDAATVEKLQPKQRLAPNVLFYGGGTPGAPEVNDLRITYTHVPLAEISVLAPQRANTLARESRELASLGFPLSFAVGTATMGARDTAQMLAQQRSVFAREAATPRAIGAILGVLAGWFLLGAFGGFGEPRTWPTKLLQAVPVVAWIWMPWAAAPVEGLAARATAQPILLAIASLLTIGALIAAFVALHRGLGGVAGRQGPRDRGAATGRRGIRRKRT